MCVEALGQATCACHHTGNLRLVCGCCCVGILIVLCETCAFLGLCVTPCVSRALDAIAVCKLVIVDSCCVFMGLPVAIFGYLLCVESLHRL